MLLNNEWVNNEIKEEIKKFLDTNENEHTAAPKPMGQSKHSPEREFHSNTGLPKKIQIFQINNLTQHLQKLQEQQQIKPRASRRKEITKIRAELNDIETKGTIQRINKSRSWFFEQINKIDKPLTRLTKKKE